MKKETKLVTSFILILLSIIIVSGILSSIKNSLEIQNIPKNYIIGIIFSSTVFSICFFYLLFSRLGTHDLIGQKGIVYLLFSMGFSLLLSLALYFLTQRLL